MSSYYKEYYNKNRERILENKKKEYRIKKHLAGSSPLMIVKVCNCGRIYTYNHQKRHERSSHHLKYIEDLERWKSIDYEIYEAMIKMDYCDRLFREWKIELNI